jgi:phage tail sheath protein FI
MPEYLAPGVYTEEVSFRSTPITAVPTSTTGFVGMTRTGPVQYRQPGLIGPSTTEPRLITEFTEFERTYGGLDELVVGGSAQSALPRTAFLAHAVRAFFLNGGTRLYVSRVFAPRVPAPNQLDLGVAQRSIAVAGTPLAGATATWRARWPGAFGNVFVETAVARSRDIAFLDPTFNAIQAQRARAGAVVEIVPQATAPVDNAPLTLAQLAVVTVGADGRQTFTGPGGVVTPTAGQAIQLVELRVFVTVGEERQDVYDALGAHPDQTRDIVKILQRDNPEDEDAVVWLDWNPAGAGTFAPAALMSALRGAGGVRLAGGHDGAEVQPADLTGRTANPADATRKATGLEALGEIDDIAIVAAPDAGTYGNQTLCEQAAAALINHAEGERYRIAIVDGPRNSSLNTIREFRGRFNTQYAALYHPWIEILDPLERAAQGAPPRRLLLPPSGFVAGIYGRNDARADGGVFKAPANEVVAGLTRFESSINKRRQEVLNPEGINALRFFEGRGNLVWGARTMSANPEWKYVNVRRLFIFLEHSIDVSTQDAVFRPNNERLWIDVRHSVEDFLFTQWRAGALLGSRPAEAFFVRCDRRTMTQNDIDNGRLIVLIGIAPTMPAEFVIFRIGQFTLEAAA